MIELLPFLLGSGIVASLIAVFGFHWAKQERQQALAEIQNSPSRD